MCDSRKPEAGADSKRRVEMVKVFLTKDEAACLVGLVTYAARPEHQGVINPAVRTAGIALMDALTSLSDPYEESQKVELDI